MTWKTKRIVIMPIISFIIGIGIGAVGIRGCAPDISPAHAEIITNTITVTKTNYEYVKEESIVEKAKTVIKREYVFNTPQFGELSLAPETPNFSKNIKSFTETKFEDFESKKETKEKINESEEFQQETKEKIVNNKLYFGGFVGFEFGEKSIIYGVEAHRKFVGPFHLGLKLSNNKNNNVALAASVGMEF